MRNQSLFDVDDAQEFSPVRTFSVSSVPQSDVDEFCRRWHYSGTGGNMSWNYGLWDAFTLVGVVSYNLPVRDACESVFGPEHYDAVAHMGRLVCADAAPRNSESRLIALSLRFLKADKPNFRAVLTYASIGAGHLGYIYQATNAIYTGQTAPRMFYRDQTGAMRSTKQGHYVTKADAHARGWTTDVDPGKHRYLYLLGNRTEVAESKRLLRLPMLPYPKETTRNGEPA